MPGTRFTLEVQPHIPAQLARLEELANDLYYSWDKAVRGLYFRLDHALGQPEIPIQPCQGELTKVMTWRNTLSRNTMAACRKNR